MPFLIKHILKKSI